MPNPNGNPGNKGGGRPPKAVEERLDAILFKAFFSNGGTKQLKRKLAKGRFSLWDRLVVEAKKGNMKALLALFEKIFASKTRVASDKDVGYEKSIREEIIQTIDEYRKSDTDRTGTSQASTTSKPVQNNK